VKYARRVDRNHGEIASALRKIGVHVVDLSRCGDGVPDLVCFQRGVVTWVEVKDGKKRPSARRLTDEQEKWHADAAVHGVRVHVVETIEQAIALFGGARCC